MTPDYERLSTRQLISECLKQDILVPPEYLEDRDGLIRLLMPQGIASGNTVTVVKSYSKFPRKRDVQDFVRYFNKRYAQLSSILKARRELQGVTSISRVLSLREREKTAIIGMVLDKTETKNKHIILTVEDTTGQIEVWLNANNRALQDIAREIVFDEVIGITGQAAGNRMFADSILFPDVPQHKELKKGLTEKYAVFVGDVEVGSTLFMRKEFDKFLAWLNGEVGSPEQRAIAQKVGYVVFIGDLVHGVGIYPGQEEDSDIHDIRAQYSAFAALVRKIPAHIQVIITVGNHDMGRLQEPQLPVPKEFAPELYEMPNVSMVSNPALVTIDAQEGHPGFDVLLYHGYSLVYYANNVGTIKDAGGMKATQDVMKLYLRKRHLAPSHGSNTYVPDTEEDPLVIDRVPDILVTGHIHDISHATYHGVTVLNCGCWNDVSDEQKKRGLEPQPAKLPIINLKTRELRVMNFYPKKTEEAEQ